LPAVRRAPGCQSHRDHFRNRYTLYDWEPIYANANFDADARNSFLVPCFKLVSTPDFAVYRLDPHVVVFCASAVGCGVVGPASTGAGPDLHSCTSGVRPLVLDSPGDRDPGLGRVWDFSQQAKDAESARLAVCVEDTADPSTAPDKRNGWVGPATTPRKPTEGLNGHAVRCDSRWEYRRGLVQKAFQTGAIGPAYAQGFARTERQNRISICQGFDANSALYLNNR
jgi:hypothetical protein